MKTWAVFLGLSLAAPLFAFDYRELRANFDDFLERGDEVFRDAETAARFQRERVTATEAHAAASVVAEERRIAFEAERIRQAKAEASLVATKREVIIGPGPEGRVIKGGKDPFHGPAVKVEIHPPAPEGFVWLFPLDPLDYRIAPKDQEVLARGERRRMELESVQRAKEAYPFLANKQDARRSQFDHFLREHAEQPMFKQLFSLTRWPELASQECAALNKW